MKQVQVSNGPDSMLSRTQAACTSCISGRVDSLVSRSQQCTDNGCRGKSMQGKRRRVLLVGVRSVSSPHLAASFFLQIRSLLTSYPQHEMLIPFGIISVYHPAYMMHFFLFLLVPVSIHSTNIT